jgi:phytoene dehydrogenase-like protein
MRAGLRLGRDAPAAARLLLGPARELLEEWFDSEPLRGTLATDAVIGAFASPATPGTGYVLFHHVMGSITGERGVWAYVRGGMGSLSDALARAARAAGAELRCNAPVARLKTQADRVTGVVLEDGEEIDADAVASCADPARTFSLVEPGALPEDFRRGLATIDYRSPVVKLNLALRALPRFRSNDRPSGGYGGEATPLSGTIHLGAQDLDAIDAAYDDARAGRVSARPVVELTLPSVVDPTLAAEGRHVGSIFAQYAPVRPNDDPDWPKLRDQMRDRALAACDEAAPGFSDLVEHVEVLAAPDLEATFGLTGGNIFHGAMSPDRLLFMRPLPGWARHRMPLAGLYLCGSGAHPGGGVMGAPGRNAAREILRALR